MVESFLWWLTIEVLGLVALPVAAVLLRALPDRGYTAAKPLGLLIVGWLAYTLAMVKVLPFGRLGLLVCVILVALFSVWLLVRNGRALLYTLQERFRNASFLRHVLAAELLFAILFAVWAWFRAFYPNIIDQEKFMDFGILNSILKSGTLPPHDPWLGGQSINYYYFGYILIAAVTALSGVAPAISFNLANAALFALTAFVAYGAVYNLIQGTILRRTVKAALAPAPAPVAPQAPPTRGRNGRDTQPARASKSRSSVPTRPVQETRLALATPGGGTYSMAVGEEVAPAPAPSRRASGSRSSASRYEAEEVSEGASGTTPRTPVYLSPILYGILGALMVVAMGNLAVPFGKKDSNANINANGWSFCFLCSYTKPGFDWWAPSRIILDYKTTPQPDGTLQKTPVGYETINEFPAFSFVLGDMHPHVMALPFVLLAVLAAYAVARRKIARSNRWRDGLPNSLAGWVSLVLTALIVGALYPANTWDYPTYLLVILVGLAIPYIAAGRREGSWRWLRPYVVAAAVTIVLSLLLFLPFHLTFKSFAGGDTTPLPSNVANIPVLGWVLDKLSGLFLINTADKTITGFLVIFGIFLLALVGWLGYELFTYLRRQSRQQEERSNTPIIFAIITVAAVLVALLLRFPLFGLLVPLICAAAYLIWQEPRRTERNVALGMFLVAATIGLGIEVIYLHDNFGNRMNTLFKFYYQMWVLWSLAGAYGFWRTMQAAFGLNRIVTSTRSGPRGTYRSETAVNDTPAGMKALTSVWAAAFLLLVLSALPYAYFGQQSRNVGAAPKDAQGNAVQQGLDGSAFIKRMMEGDDEAIAWLNSHASGSDVVLECCRNEYDLAGRISSFTGIPTLVSWDTSHESLWRSSQPDLKAEIGQRRAVTDAIYQGKDPTTGVPLTPAALLDLLHKYNVTYVVVGSIERGAANKNSRSGQLDPAEEITPYAENVMKAANMPVLFQSQAGNTTIYGVNGAKADPNAVVPTPVPPQPTPLPGTPQADLSAPAAGLFDHGPGGVNRGQFSLPRGIARDAQGNFYVADTENKRIQKFDPSGKWLLMYGALGTEQGQFGEISPGSTGTGPGGVAVDKAGNLYVADTWNHRIEKFNSKGEFVTTWGAFISLADPNSASDPDKDSKFYGPRGVAVGPDDNVYVTDTGNKRVLIFDQNGKLVRKIDSGMSPTKVAPDYPFNKPGELNEPIGIAVDGAGNVYVADTNNKRIQKFDSTGKPVAQWPIASPNWDPGPYLEPFLALDGAGNLYATAPTGKTVLKFGPDGKLLGSKNAASGATLSLPTGIWVDPDGTVYVTDTTANTVLNLGKIP